MGWCEDSMNLSQWSACAIKVWQRNSALYVPCSLVLLARVVVVRVILVDVLCHCHACPHWSAYCRCCWCSYRSHFCCDFLFLEMYSLHPPSVTVNRVDCYRNNHSKLCTKFFVRLMPQINRRFTDCPRFPRSISVKSIVVVMSQRRDATRKFGIARTRRNCATNLQSAHCPPFSWGGTMSTVLSWSQVDALSASCRNPKNLNGSTSCHDIHQFLLLWQYDCPSQGWLLQSDPTRS